MNQLLDTVKTKWEFVGIIEPKLWREEYITREWNKYFYTQDWLKTYKALKSSNGEDIEFTLTYDSDLRFHEISDKILKDAIKEISFTRKWEEYRIRAVYDENHKAKLYWFRDWKMFSFYEKSHNEFFPLFKIWYTKSCQWTYWSYNDKNIDKAIIILEEVLGFNNIDKEKTSSQNKIKETEQQLNEVFEYGQKVIFQSNSTNFISKDIDIWLDKIYEILYTNTNLKIKIIWYYGWTHPILPLERAKKVRDYLVNKWISMERIEIEWWEEKIAKSIKIQINN